MLLSAVLNFIFVELLPQGLFVKYGLQICGRMIWFIKLIVCIFCIPTFPAWMLMHFIFTNCRSDREMFDNQKLLKFVELHAKSSARGGELDPRAIQITKAAIDMHIFVASNIMKEISRVRMLDATQKLNQAKIQKIVDWGYTKIPVFDLGNNEHSSEGANFETFLEPGSIIRHLPSMNIIGFLDVKKLAFADTTEELRVSDLELAPLPFVPQDYEVFDVLKLFQMSKSRIAVVVKEYPSPLLSYTDHEIDDDNNLTVRRSRPNTSNLENPPNNNSHSGSTPWTDTPSLPSSLHPLGIITYDDILQQFFRKPGSGGGETRTSLSASTREEDSTDVGLSTAAWNTSSTYQLSSAGNSVSSSRRNRLSNLNRRRVGFSRWSATSGSESPKTDAGRLGIRGLVDFVTRRLDNIKPKKGEDVPLNTIRDEEVGHGE